MGKKIAYVKMDFIMGVLRQMMNPNVSVRYDLDGIPPDATISAVSHDISRDCVAVVFEHPSFPHVPGYHELPLLDWHFTTTSADDSVPTWGADLVIHGDCGAGKDFSMSWVLPSSEADKDRMG